MIGNTRATRVAGLVLDVAIPWGLAIAEIVNNDLDPNGIPLNTVIAGAVKAVEARQVPPVHFDRTAVCVAISRPRARPSSRDALAACSAVWHPPTTPRRT